jgi:hypothetical protein
MPAAYFDWVGNGSCLIEGLDNSVEKTNAGDVEPQLYNSTEVVLDALVSPSARLLWQFLVAAESAARKLDLAELAGRAACRDPLSLCSVAIPYVVAMLSVSYSLYR